MLIDNSTAIAPIRPLGAKILVVLDVPSAGDRYTKAPMSGDSGREMLAMLQEAGLPPADCVVTYAIPFLGTNGDIGENVSFTKSAAPGHTAVVFNYAVRPLVQVGHELLQSLIQEIQPELIITCGSIALWMVTHGQKRSASVWRGSQLFINGVQFVPTLSPRTIMKQWAWRHIMVADLRRAAKWMISKTVEAETRFTIRPSFDAVMSTLASLQDRVELDRLDLAVDLETKTNHIDCIGLAWSVQDAICIPIMERGNEDGYWSFEEELEIVYALYKLLTHKNCNGIGQNFIYDSQFFFRHYCYLPNIKDDTLVMQHTAFAGEQKSLDFLASIYSKHYVYWKDEREEAQNDDEGWLYNCKDCVHTYEVAMVLRSVLQQLNLTSQYAFQMQRFWPAVTRMALRGVRINKQVRSELAMALLDTNNQLDKVLTEIVGAPLNIKSSKQMQQFLYEGLGLPVVRNRKTKRPSADFESLQKLAEKEPLLHPIVDLVLTQRSIGVFVSTFLQAELDKDDRFRCEYSIAGAETNRLSSRKTAFGTGGNMQNIPDGKRKKLLVPLPNVKKLFLPERGNVIGDIDLDRADLQVVVWEADDSDLKRQLRLGVDLHIMNGILLAGKEPPPEDELIENHPNYKEHKARYVKERQLAKNFVHGTNYGGKEKTMAAVCQITIKACADLQNRWFEIHPGIKKWHARVEHQLATTRTVENAFGFKRRYFDRVESVLPEALAWIPQSTVARVTAGMQANIEEKLPTVTVSMQVHDSLVIQYSIHEEYKLLPEIHEQCLIEIPYPDPLIIPVGIKTSTISWGDCKERAWPNDVLQIG